MESDGDKKVVSNKYTPRCHFDDMCTCSQMYIENEYLRIYNLRNRDS